MPATKKKPSPPKVKTFLTTVAKAVGLGSSSSSSSSRENGTGDMIADTVMDKAVNVVENTPQDIIKWNAYKTLGTISSASSAKQQDMYKAALFENETLSATNTNLEAEIESKENELKTWKDDGTKNLHKAQNWHSIALKLGDIIYNSADRSNLIASVTLKQLHTSKKDELERKLTPAELDGLIRITPNATPNVVTDLKKTFTGFFGMKKGGTKRQKIQRRRKTRKYRI